MHCKCFAYEDDYSFRNSSISIHWIWFINRCSTLKSRYRYTSNTVFDTFPGRRNRRAKAIKAVAAAAVAFEPNATSFARSTTFISGVVPGFGDAGDHPLKDAHAALDEAVRSAYGMSCAADPLAFLLELNATLRTPKRTATVQGAGLPSFINDRRPTCRKIASARSEAREGGKGAARAQTSIRSTSSSVTSSARRS